MIFPFPPKKKKKKNQYFIVTGVLNLFPIEKQKKISLKQQVLRN